MNTLDDFQEEDNQGQKFDWIWRIERILFAVLIIGIMFKLMHWPGAGILLILGLTTLSMLYLLSFIKSNQGSAMEKFAQKIMATSLSVMMVGMLFSIQHYPGSSTMVNVSVISGILGLLLFTASTKRFDFWNHRYPLRVLVFGLLTILMSTSLIFPKITHSAYVAPTADKYASITIYSDETCRFSNQYETERGVCWVDGNTIGGIIDAKFTDSLVTVVYRDSTYYMTPVMINGESL